MCDFLTDNPGESDFPTEQESWKPVDASETEADVQKMEKQMKALTTKPKVEESDPTPPASESAGFEADFSDPVT